MFTSDTSWFRFVVLVGHLLCLHDYGECVEYTIPVEKSQTIILPPNETSSIFTSGLFIEDARFVVIQMHSQKSTIFLSVSNEFQRETTKIGTGVGLVTLLDYGQYSSTWFVMVNSTESVTVSVIVQLYTHHDPIPGGCNQVFNLELDPSIVLIKEGHHRTSVMFQWANLALPQGRDLPDCENEKVIADLEYDIYVYFMQQRDLGEAEFLKAVQQMLSPQEVEQHGIKVYSERDSPSSHSQVSVTSRANQGAVYSIIVRRKDTGRTATYTSAVSYGCSFQADTCDVAVSPLQVVVAIACGVLGLYLLLFGHHYFKATQAVFGFIFSCLLTYILLSQAAVQDWVLILVVVVAGVIGGGLWLAMWQRFNFPIIQVFLMGLCSGYLVAAVVFFTPFGNMSLWTPTANYALCFVCCALLFTVLLMAFTKFLSILSCCLVGSLLTLSSVAVPLWSSLVMIFLNAIYHQTEPGYAKVKVVYPLNTQDIVLYALWPTLTLLGVGFQLYLARGNKGFSKPFGLMRSHLLQHHQLPWPSLPHGNPHTQDEEERLNVSDSLTLGRDDSETSRLLPGSNHGSESYRSFERRPVEQQNKKDYSSHLSK